MTKTEFYTRYIARDASDALILGFCYEGTAYTIRLPEVPERFVKLSRSSSSHKRGMQTLRLRLTVTDKEELIAAGAEIFGKAEILHDPKLNKGQMLEKIVTERAGQVWKPNNKPFWEGGDVVIDGVDYQVKFEEATLATEHAVI